jgi:hypothetical protein
MPGERRMLQRISRGLPQLRALRQVVEEIYRLFDRRCRTETALSKLARLRCRVRRFKKLRPIFQKLQSPNLEKALTYLDDRLLGSTSNAVERGNRRHRKMQRSVYRVRTQSLSHESAVEPLKGATGRSQGRQPLEAIAPTWSQAPEGGDRTYSEDNGGSVAPFGGLASERSGRHRLQGLTPLSLPTASVQCAAG